MKWCLLYLFILIKISIWLSHESCLYSCLWTWNSLPCFAFYFFILWFWLINYMPVCQTFFFSNYQYCIFTCTKSNYLKLSARVIFHLCTRICSHWIFYILELSHVWGEDFASHCHIYKLKIHCLFWCKNEKY